MGPQRVERIAPVLHGKAGDVAPYIRGTGGACPRDHTPSAQGLLRHRKIPVAWFWGGKVHGGRDLANDLILTGQVLQFLADLHHPHIWRLLCRPMVLRSQREPRAENLLRDEPFPRLGALIGSTTQEDVMIGKGRAYEEYLVAEARLRNPQAVSALIRLRGPRLLVHATRLLGERDLAQDAVQEAWIEILRGLPGLRNHAAFPAWATRIVTRRCARIIRGLQRTRAITRDAPPISTVVAGSPVDDQQQLRWAIDQLPPAQAATIALFYLEDMRLSEVAIALDVPEGTVKSRLSLARRTLRDLLKGEEDDKNDELGSGSPD